MAAAEAIIAALERNWSMVDQALEGLDVAVMNQRPNDQCNSIAWMLWHMNRVADRFFTTRLRGVTQVWLAGGWFRRYSMDNDPDVSGVGWTSEQVGKWQAPRKDVQMGYYEAVKKVARDVLWSLTPDDLTNRTILGVQLGGTRLTILPPEAERRSVAVALGVTTWDNCAHGGQIAYLRGLYTGMGWLAPSESGSALRAPH